MVHTQLRSTFHSKRAVYYSEVKAVRLINIWSKYFSMIRKRPFLELLFHTLAVGSCFFLL